MSLTTWTAGDVSAGTALTADDHLYESHLNELRTATNGLEFLLDPDDQTLNITNAGTSYGLNINQSGVLASNKNALYVSSNAIQTLSGLVHFLQDNASSDNYCLQAEQDGTGYGIYLNMDGAGTGMFVDNASTQYSIYIDRSGIGASGRPNLYVIDSNASSVGNTVQIDNSGTGHGLIVNQLGNLTSGGRGLRVYSDVAQTNTGAILALFEVGNASAVNFPVVVINQDSPSNALWIEQNGRGRSFVIDNNNEGNSFAIDQDVTDEDFGDGTSFTYGVDLDFKAVVTNGQTYTKSGNMFSIISGVTETSGTITDTAIVLNIQQSHADATGDLVFLNVDANALALDIDKDCTVNNTRTWAAKIASDNAGTGTALGCGIDMSSFSVTEPVFKTVVDDTSIPGTTNSTGRIAIDRGGTTVYVPYYA